jgi:hypothetical protein
LLEKCIAKWSYERAKIWEDNLRWILGKQVVRMEEIQGRIQWWTFVLVVLDLRMLLPDDKLTFIFQWNFRLPYMENI